MWLNQNVWDDYIGGITQGKEICVCVYVCVSG